MIHVALCEDEQYMAETVRERLGSVFTNRGIEFRIDLFKSGEEFFDSRKELTKYDLVFLDVNMDSMTGVDVARQLREIGSAAKIVFVSGVLEAAPMGYEVDAFRYVIKDELFAKHFDACVNDLIDKYLAPSAQFIFKIQDMTYTLSLQRIAYFESQLRKTVVYYAHQESTDKLDEPDSPYIEYESKSFYARFADIETQLSSKWFIRIHKGYLVNACHIKKLDSEFLTMTDGMLLPISKARRPEVKRMYLKWKAG